MLINAVNAILDSFSPQEEINVLLLLPIVKSTTRSTKELLPPVTLVLILFIFPVELVSLVMSPIVSFITTTELAVFVKMDTMSMVMNVLNTKTSPTVKTIITPSKILVTSVKTTPLISRF
jgi:hypothetical protein